MSEILYMIKRNILVYIRNRSAVFFSLLSAIIVVVLMFCFLGNMSATGITDALSQFGGVRDAEADLADTTYLVRLWIIAGVIIVNSISVPLTVLGGMVGDEEIGRARSFYVTGTSRYKLTVSYILSAWIIGTVMCLITFILGEVIFFASGYGLLGITAALKVLGIIMINTFVYSCIGYLISLFIHTGSAWSGFLTIVGTLSGFLGGTYLSIENFPTAVQNVLKVLPVLHGTSMLRVVMTESIEDTLFADVIPELRDAIEITLGNNVTLPGSETELFSLGTQMLILTGYAIIPLVAAVILDSRRKLKDR